MMKRFLLACAVVSWLGGLAGCASLDTTGPGSAERVLTGVVTNNAGGTELPPNTEVMVRVVDLARGEGRGEVLGEETIKNPRQMPVPFKIEFRAEDAVLRGSVAIEARISVGGRLRYTTVAGHPVTPGNVNDPHTVEVELAAGR